MTICISPVKMAAYYHMGTVMPTGDTFDAEAASKTLRRSMKGIGTDENGIIDVLANHSNTELQEIRIKYQSLYGRELHDDIRDELGGHLETLAAYLIMKREVFDAFCLRHAIEGLGTKEITLIEILSSRNNLQLEAIKREYKRVFNSDLEKDIINDTSGNFRNLLVALVAADRDENQKVGKKLVEQDAKDLFEAGEARFGTDESKFIQIAINRSIPHLHGVFDEYKKLNPNGIEDAIKSETSGDFRKGLLAVVAYAMDPLSHFADSFHETMAGSGTDDERLMQLVVSHCEVDLKNIGEVYMKKYKTSLVRAIGEDTSGDYKKLLVQLVNPGTSSTSDREPT